VIRIPEASAPGVKIQLATQSFSLARGHQLESPVEFKRVETADSTDPAISRQNLVAQITRIGTQSPLVDAIISAKGSAAFRHFQSAPSADASPMGPSYLTASDPTAGFFP
jgi:hypothetical protein